jgi:hypothetical protein
MRSRTCSAIVLAAIALVGCGGGDDGEQPPPPKDSRPSSTQGKAVFAWTQSAQAYWNKFRDCGAGVRPVRAYFATCTKQTREQLLDDGRRAVREVERASTSACASERRRLKATIRRMQPALERAVRAFDRSNDAALGKAQYNGPPPYQLFVAGQGKLESGVASSLRLSRAIDAGC